MQQEFKRHKRKQRVGIVISDKMNKTITVRVDSLAKHPVYTRAVRKSIKFKAHDEKNEARAGDTVKIIETRPISKDKRWRLAGIVKKPEEAR
ncbi:30S ribosomal protein S17 [Candidatus Omnitrophota bacterium]